MRRGYGGARLTQEDFVNSSLSRAFMNGRNLLARSGPISASSGVAEAVEDRSRLPRVRGGARKSPSLRYVISLMTVSGRFPDTSCHGRGLGVSRSSACAGTQAASVTRSSQMCLPASPSPD